MSEWKEYRLVDFATIHNESRVPLSKMERSKRQGKFPYYGASGIIDYLDDYLFDGEYVLISEDGENLKSRQTPIAFKANGQFWVNNHSHILKGKKDFHNNLLVYYFKNLDLNPFITGAVQPKLNKANLLSIPIYLPENEEEQRAIAEVLSSLDDKIDLLHRQNKILEQMAETLFRQWFVEDAKEDWNEGNLGMLANIDSGFAFKSKFYQDTGNLKVIRGKNVTIGSLRWGTDAKFWNDSIEGLDRYLLDKWDIVIGMDGSRIGQNRAIVLETDLPAILAQRVARLKAKSAYHQPFIWKHIISNDFREYIISIHTGTSIPHISQKQIADYEILIPPSDKIDNYSEIVWSFWDKQERNHEQIRTLEKMRDTLLPKLMSGEVKISIDG